MLQGGGCKAEGGKGGGIWDNCNSIINKVYLKSCHGEKNPPILY